MTQTTFKWLNVRKSKRESHVLARYSGHIMLIVKSVFDNVHTNDTDLDKEEALVFRRRLLIVSMCGLKRECSSAYICRICIQ